MGTLYGGNEMGWVCEFVTLLWRDFWDLEDHVVWLLNWVSWERKG